MRKLVAPVLYVCGTLLMVLAAMMLIPAAFEYAAEPEPSRGFLISAGIVASVGLATCLLNRSHSFTLNTRQLYLLTSFSWLLMGIAGTLPIWMCIPGITAVDAIFESVSGLTTTGSTVLSGIETLPHAVLLWRSILQWMGGLGVIGMATSVMPFLSVGGMRLFRSESSDWSDKSLPRFETVARSLLIFYVLVTLCCALCYSAAGLGSFDAINYAMTTVSTGGFGTGDHSMGNFELPVLWVSVVFMLIGGLPFSVFIHAVLRRSVAGLSDQQVKAFFKSVLFMAALLVADLVLTHQLPLLEAVTHATFNVVSVITTTGYASMDYTLWGDFSIGMFFLLTLIGGCSGSTSGGMKIFRFQLAFESLRNQLRRLVHPTGVFSIRYNGRVVQDDILDSTVAFCFLFFVTLGATTLTLTALGVDFLTSFTGAATALANVGPGLGSVIGPSGNFEMLPDSAKYILCLVMILGRLELLTVMVLLTRTFWRA